MVVMAAAACGGKSKPAETPPSTKEAPPPDAVVEQCFAGVSKISTAGQVVGEQQVVAYRKLDRAAGLITEELDQPSDKGGVDHFVVLMKVDGATAQMTEASGAFTGTVTFEGADAWTATAWSSEAVLPDGPKVTSDDRIYGDTLRVEKTVTLEGYNEIRTDEELIAFDCAELAAKRAALGTR